MSNQKAEITYEDEFRASIERTHNWGMPSIEFSEKKDRYINEATLKKVGDCISSHISHLEPSDISQQCFAVSLALLKPLQETLGVPVHYTLGYVRLNGRPVFYTAEDGLKEILTSGFSNPAFNLHAWLTLPSHEIIDITFGTSYGVVNNEPKLIGSMVVLHPDQLTKGLSYHPQLVGESFLERVGALKNFSFFSL